MQPRSKFAPLWLLLGGLSLALGLIGIVLPLLPTTVFLLLAAFCFARSSPRLHAWLLNHKTFGPPIRDWQEKGAINRRSKVTAVVMIALTFAVSVFLKVPSHVLGIQAVILSAVSVFILTRPEH